MKPERTKCAAWPHNNGGCYFLDRFFKDTPTGNTSLGDYAVDGATAASANIMVVQNGKLRIIDYNDIDRVSRICSLKLKLVAGFFVLGMVKAHVFVFIADSQSHKLIYAF